MGIKINFFNKEGALDNSAIGAGIYLVELLKDGEPSSSALPLYIDESVYMVKRCGEHLYELFQDPSYFGLTCPNLSDGELTLSFKLIECLSANVNKEYLKKKEKDYIRKYGPLTQNPDGHQQIRNIKDKVEIVQNAINNHWKN